MHGSVASGTQAQQETSVLLSCNQFQSLIIISPLPFSSSAGCWPRAAWHSWRPGTHLLGARACAARGDRALLLPLPSLGQGLALLARPCNPGDFIENPSSWKQVMGGSQLSLLDKRSFLLDGGESCDCGLTKQRHQFLTVTRFSRQSPVFLGA